MRILIEGRSGEYYLAKCHEAFRTGLRATFDARPFGKHYPGSCCRLFLRTYAQIIGRVFPDGPPDVVLAHNRFPENPRRFPRGFNYRGFPELPMLKGFVFGDYWGLARRHHEAFAEFVVTNKVDFILSYFPQPLEIWANTPVAERMLCLPPCFDPELFHDWRMPKTYDVGFLAAGTARRMRVYPERFAIHQKLLKMPGIRYLWARHPGWRLRKRAHPLVGENFSKAINSCRMFVTTGGKYRNAHAKYVEILASRTLLLADEPIGAERLGLEDGINYVRISEADALDKVAYYLAHPDEAEQIADAGYATAFRLHDCRRRALDFYEAMRAKFPQLKATPCKPAAWEEPPPSEPRSKDMESPRPTRPSSRSQDRRFLEGTPQSPLPLPLDANSLSCHSPERA